MYQVLFYIVAYFTLANCGEVFDVYKMLQYEKNSEQFGSLKTTFNLIATTINSKETQLSKYVVMIHQQDFNAITLADLLERQVGSILVILPNEMNDSATWGTFENQLRHESIPVPVYFTFETPQSQSFYNTIQSNQNQVDRL